MKTLDEILSQVKTDRDREFVRQYITMREPSAQAAAIAAGFSKTTARTKSYGWVGNSEIKPEVYKAIREAQRLRSEQAETDAAWLLRRLREEADADIKDLMDDEDNLLPVSEWPIAFRRGLVVGLEVEEMMIEGVKVSEVKKIKQVNRQKHLEMIGKHVAVGAFEDVVNHKGLDSFADRLARAQERLDSEGEEDDE